jgi:peptide/nickel transport system substrate-binding protein
MHPRRFRLAHAALCAGIASLALTACGSSSSSSPPGQQGSTAAHGGTAYFAEQPGFAPHYIFPLTSPAFFSTPNVEQFQQLMFRPLYWYGSRAGTDSYPVLNRSLSLADPPVYSDNDTVVTIKLKSYRWSDGTPVSSRDVTFWMNMLKANKADWGAYVPGKFPDNVTSYKAEGPHTVVMKLNGRYNPQWFTYNQLDQINPLPHQAWDKTSASGKIGNYDETASGAHAVYTFLAHEATNLSTYATNPLWQVVDGPWRLSAFTTAGQATFVPNRSYSGPVKPKLAKFVELPFTSATSELNTLLAGGVTVGYLPTTALPERSTLSHRGFNFAPWSQFGIGYIALNFNNPQVGPVIRQLYVRQALQRLVDQPAYIKTFLHGTGTPTYGPVPVNPTNPYDTSVETSNPYPYSPSSSGQLLASHGWAKRAGVQTCVRPGSGASDCGPGISAGMKLKFTLQFASGIPFLTQEMTALQSSAQQQGIAISLPQAPVNTVFGTAVPCTPKQSACSWQMEDWGFGWTYTGEDNYPTGDALFETGAVTNAGNYSNPANDALINKTLRSGPAALAPYENYLAKQLPVIWMPLAPYQLTEVSKLLKGATPQDSVQNIYPEDWSLTK